MCRTMCKERLKSRATPLRGATKAFNRDFLGLALKAGEKLQLQSRYMLQTMAFARATCCRALHLRAVEL